MTNHDIATVLERLATMLEIDGANPFRIRAYREAARIVDTHAEPMSAVADREGALESIKGIGKDLSQKIRDLVATGSTELYREMQHKVPLEVAALTELQGLGAKRVRTLMTELGIKNRADLAAAAHAGRLRDLPGFGATTEQNVIKALATAEQASGRVVLHAAWEVAHALLAHVKGVAGVTHAELAGSFRRRRETIGDLDIVVSGGRAEAVMEAFVRHPEVADVLGQGDTKSSVRLTSGLQVDLRHVPPASFGAALLYFTGSKSHNIELRKIAIEGGMSLNEYGLTRGERVVAGRTEEQIYRALGMDWIPPELRESHDEIELARAGRLPVLITPEDLRADLHMHSDRSDGLATLEQMVRAAQARGYAYCAITEHSQSLAMANGFDAARVRRSVKEIAAVREAVPGIEVLHGLEVDILADGSLDLDDASLALLDWVIISLHSRLQMPRAEMTKRVLRAIDHPLVCAMGHPTARRLGLRDPVELDLDAVFERAAERSVAMEINAQPDRTDLSDINARLAASRGVNFVIDTDAHAVKQLEYIRYGVFVARRAGLTKTQVLNTQPFGRFRERLERKRAGGAPASAGAAARASRPAAGKRRVPAVARPTRPAAGKPAASGPARTRRSPARKRPSPG